MIKFLAIIINLFGAVFISFFINPEIKVDLSVPAEVNAGEEFLVTVTISKSSLESFSRFQQDLPYGLKASRVSTANADFTFESQRMRLIWLKLPSDPVITVVYKVMVDERLKGTFTLDAEFSYISGNERKNIIVKGPDKIMIIPNKNLAENQMIDINEFEKIFLADIEREKKAEKLECLRSTPVQTSPREFIVELIVNKGSLNKFAKIEEFIPEGFIASEIDSQDGIFSFEKGTIKYLWMNLPEKQEFSIKYKLFAEKGKTIDDLKLSGSFSYIKGNQTETFEILEKNPNTEIENGELAVNKTIEVIEKEEEIQPIKFDEVKPDELKDEIKTFPKQMIIPGDANWLLQAEQGIYFRVQLAAGHKAVNVPNYFKRLQVKENVKYEIHDGWHKYTTGSFSEYREARDHRTNIWRNTPVKDAFIAAYNNGKRISVQEALMITNQKWYR